MFILFYFFVSMYYLYTLSTKFGYSKLEIVNTSKVIGETKYMNIDLKNCNLLLLLLLKLLFGYLGQINFGQNRYS